MAQKQMVCQFCETSTNIKWKCINCDVIMCEDCKTKIHAKIRNSDEHDVICIKQFNATSASEKYRTLDLKNIPCPNHTSETCFIYCRDCSVLLCSICLIKSHQNHKLANITDVYQEKVLELKDLEEKSNEHMKSFSERENQLVTAMSKGQTQYDDIIQKVLKQETEINKEARKQSENLVNEMNKLWKPQENRIAQRLEEIRGMKGDLSKQVSDMEDTFLSPKAMPIFTVCNNIQKDLPAISPTTDTLVKQIILSEMRPVKYILNLGSLKTIPELKVAQTYHSDLSEIYKVKTLNDGTQVLCSRYTEDKNICKFELKDSECLTTILAEDVDTDVIDMTITKQGKLLFSRVGVSEVTCLENLSSDTTMETFTSISPLYARGIHATDKNILIGFCDCDDDDDLFPLTEDSRRGIIVQDYNGKHIRTLEHDTNNDRIFSLPDAITTNINGDICVSDNGTDDWERRVIVLTELGSVKWMYKGHPSINSENEFTPWDLVTTSEGFLLVADWMSNAIHMLSIDGDLLTCLTEKHGIKKPMCVNIDKSRKLLIGCDSFYTSDHIAKLHVAEFTI